MLFGVVVLAAVLGIGFGFVVGFDAGTNQGYRNALRLVNHEPLGSPPCPKWLVWIIEVVLRRGDSGAASEDTGFVQQFPRLVQ